MNLNYKTAGCRGKRMLRSFRNLQITWIEIVEVLHMLDLPVVEGCKERGNNHKIYKTRSVHNYKITRSFASYASVAGSTCRCSFSFSPLCRSGCNHFPWPSSLSCIEATETGASEQLLDQKLTKQVLMVSFSTSTTSCFPWPPSLFGFLLLLFNSFLLSPGNFFLRFHLTFCNSSQCALLTHTSRSYMGLLLTASWAPFSVFVPLLLGYSNIPYKQWGQDQIIRLQHGITSQQQKPHVIVKIDNLLGPNLRPGIGTGLE